jgi:hemoglobin
MTDTLDEALLPQLLDHFYAQVRADALLGPVFETVDDWPQHLRRLRDFWSSVMLTTGRYKGNPVEMHVALADRMDPAMFVRWLEIWAQQTDAMLPATTAALMQKKAERIATSLQAAIAVRQAHRQAAEAKSQPPSRPYYSTAVFDNETLPKALRRSHRTKAGTWGVIRVLDGQLRYRRHGERNDVMLSPDRCGLIRPEELHCVEPVGDMRMQVDFYDHEPVLSALRTRALNAATPAGA